MSIADRASMKLQTKQREGSKVRRIYDQAQTPRPRLLASGAVSPTKQQELLRLTEVLDPVRLLQQLQHLQKARLPACDHVFVRKPWSGFSASVFCEAV
jgi:hypothetical protein